MKCSLYNRDRVFCARTTCRTTVGTTILHMVLRIDRPIVTGCATVCNAVIKWSRAGSMSSWRGTRGAPRSGRYSGRDGKVREQTVPQAWYRSRYINFTKKFFHHVPHHKCSREGLLVGFRQRKIGQISIYIWNIWIRSQSDHVFKKVLKEAAKKCGARGRSDLEPPFGRSTIDK